MTLTKSFRTTLIVGTVASACAAFVGLPVANAGFVAAPLHFSIDVSGMSGFTFSDSYEADAKFPLGGGQFAYEILDVDLPQFNFNPTTLTIANGAPSATAPAGIFTGFAFKNTTNENLKVVITLLVETNFDPGLGSVPWDTNVSIGVNSNTVISTFDGAPFWLAAIDGGTVAQLFAHKSSLAGIDGAASADMSAIGLDDAPSTSMSITISFEINPGGQAFFNGNFTMIPVPGSLALLAIGGFVAVGRRRRS